MGTSVSPCRAATHGRMDRLEVLLTQMTALTGSTEVRVGVVPARYHSPRYQTHCEPSFPRVPVESIGIL
jgi:hypothetical protein